MMKPSIFLFFFFLPEKQHHPRASRGVSVGTFEMVLSILWHFLLFRECIIGIEKDSGLGIKNHMERPS